MQDQKMVDQIDQKTGRRKWKITKWRAKFSELKNARQENAEPEMQWYKMLDQIHSVNWIKTRKNKPSIIV